MNSFNEIQKLLQDRADCQSRMKLIPYDGSPEIKENSSGKAIITMDEIKEIAMRIKELREKTYEGLKPEVIKYLDNKLIKTVAISASL